MTDLIRAAQAVIDDTKRRVGLHPSRRELFDNLEAALVAHRAEILRRREASPWRGPFTPSVFASHEVVKNQRGAVIIHDLQSKTIAAALNAYFGYDENGEDVLDA